MVDKVVLRTTPELCLIVVIIALIFEYETFGLPAHDIGIAMLTVATLLTLASGYLYFAEYFRGLSARSGDA